MKFVPNAITNKVGRQLLQTQKASPTLLFGAGVVGVVATTVLACRATLRVEEVLEKTQEGLKTVDEVVHDEKHDNYTDKDAKKDKAYIYIRSGVELGKLYGPAIVLGVVSIGCLTGAHNILSKRNASLTAAYAALDKGFKEYRKRVSDEIGEDREREVYFQSEACEIEDEKTGKKKTVQKVGNGSASIYARFFDEHSSSWQTTPEYNVVFLRVQQNWLNDRLKSKGHVFLNEVYDALGIERSKEGAVVGWVWKGGGDDYIDFGIFDREMQPQQFDFFTGREGSILLDFNVDGVIFDKI